jgi:exosortase
MATTGLLRTPSGSGTRKWAIEALVLCGATLVLYYPVLLKLGSDWWHDPNYSHEFFVPLMAAYLVWERRHSLARQPLQPSNWGLVLLLGGLVLLFLGVFGAELFLTRLSLLPLLAGAVLFLCGRNWLKRLMFPVLLLLLMIPLPEIILNQITFPLQLTASHLAAGCLNLTGVPVLLEGNLITLPHEVVLQVAEACSGIRSLMALVSLAVAYGYFFDKRSWMRAILVLSAVPIAVVTNSLRVAATGLLTYFVGQEMAEGFFHTFTGWMIFMLALGFVVVFHKALSFMIGRTRMGDTRCAGGE